MRLLLNPRGTHGSGKSFVMNSFMKMHKLDGRPIYGALGPRLPEAYPLRVEGVTDLVYVIGPYVTVCGGTDCISSLTATRHLIDKYAAKGHTLFEGMMASGVYGQLGEHLEQYKKRVNILFLRTSLEKCIARVQARRDERGVDALEDLTNIKKKFASVRSVRKRVARDGIFRWHLVTSSEAAAYMTTLLQKEG